MSLLLVTGASGFLGSEIVRKAESSGLSVRASSRRSLMLSRSSDFFPADITVPSSLAKAVAGVDTVIHSAGLAHVFHESLGQAALFQKINEIGTANVASAAARFGVKHFILVSSVSVYGGSRDGGHEESGLFPDAPYALSKYAAEQRAVEIAESSGMALTILRLATLFGAGDPGNVAKLMRSIDSRSFIWVGDGTNRKSLLHVRDAALACVKVVQAPACGINIYNVSSRPCSMKAIVHELSIALGKGVCPLRIPSGLALATASALGAFGKGKGRLASIHSTLLKWLSDDIYDSRKIQRVFNFVPEVELRQGIAEEVAFYKKAEINK